MRLLFMLQGRVPADQIGFVDGCARLKADGSLADYRILPTYGLAEAGGWPHAWREALNAAAAIGADAVMLQHFHGPIPDPTDFIAALRALPTRPVIAVTAGDSFGRFFGSAQPSFRTASRLADVTFTIEFGSLMRHLVRCGSRRVTLMPHGYCQVRFETPPPDPADYRPDYDVVMVGNLWHVRNPLRAMFHAARARRRQAEILQSRYGRRFALFGRGWEGFPSARGPVPFDRQHDVLRKARVIVGAHHLGHSTYYMSDRSALSIRSGIPLIDVRMPRIDRIYRHGEHWFLYRGEEELLATCDRLLGWSDDQRLAFGRRAAEAVVDRHSQHARLRSMTRIMGDIRRDLLAGREPAPPVLDYLLPETDAAAELTHATMGWGG